MGYDTNTEEDIQQDIIPGTVNGIHTPIVMDSGATRYYVPQNLVKPYQWGDKKVKVALSDRSRVMCRTARVNIRFGDRDETRTAIVFPRNSDVLYPTSLMSEWDIQLVKKYGNKVKMICAITRLNSGVGERK